LRERGEGAAYCFGGFVFVTTTSPVGFVSSRTGWAVVTVVEVLTAAVARVFLRVVAFDVIAFVALVVLAVANADCEGTVAIVAFDVAAIAAFDTLGIAEFVAAAVVVAPVAGVITGTATPPTALPVIPGPISADETDEFTVVSGLTTTAGLTNTPVGGVGAMLCAPSGFTLPRTRPWYA
jgi:hypothetical protein